MIVTLYLVGSTVEKYGVPLVPRTASNSHTDALYGSISATFQILINRCQGQNCPGYITIS